MEMIPVSCGESRDGEGEGLPEKRFEVGDPKFLLKLK